MSPPPRSLTIEEIAPGTRTSYEFPRHDWDPPFSVGGWVGLGFKLGKHSQEKTRVLPSIPSTMLFASSVLVFCFCFKMDETTCLVDAFKYFLECSSKRSLGEMIHVNDYFFWEGLVQPPTRKGWKAPLHPGKLTWNLKMMEFNRNLLFQGLIFRVPW